MEPATENLGPFCTRADAPPTEPNWLGRVTQPCVDHLKVLSRVLGLSFQWQAGGLSSGDTGKGQRMPGTEQTFHIWWLNVLTDEGHEAWSLWLVEVEEKVELKPLLILHNILTHISGRLFCFYHEGNIVCAPLQSYPILVCPDSITCWLIKGLILQLTFSFWTICVSLYTIGRLFLSAYKQALRSPILKEPALLLLLPQAAMLLFAPFTAQCLWSVVCTLSISASSSSFYLFFKPALIRISSSFPTKTALTKLTSDLVAAVVRKRATY